MATITKTLSGFLFEDKFDSHNLLWDVSPNDYSRVVYESGYVGLKHGDERLTMSIPTPSEDYVLQAEIYHNPISLSDVGGIAVLSNNNNQIEYHNYFSGTADSNIFRYVKMCVEKGVYNFFASKDGLKWVLVGNSEMADANRVGFFIEGIESLVADIFRVINVEFYKSNILTFNNIPVGSTVQILKEDGTDALKDIDYTTKWYGNKMMLDLTKTLLPIPNARLIVTNGIGTTVADIPGIDINGGDIFEYSYDIEISIGSSVVSNNTIFDLGRVTGKETLIPITITNKENITLSGLKISIIPVAYYRGGEFVTLAVNYGPGTTPVFYDKLDAPDILSNEGLEVILKIDRDLSQIGPAFADAYRFKIVVE
jgi:hypothetical protein